ncbi:MAG: hypothetical protein Q7R47_03640, partial [Candidatus Diapherotrites archaeon]|nr:hypothetical protein [Candidatus Diapherotrites archaeon]
IEYLLVTSFLLVASGLIFAYATNNYQQSASTGLARGAVTSIVNAAEQTYALGDGSVIFIEVEIPSNITDVKMQYVCKDDYTDATHSCLYVDPEDNCCAEYTDLATKKICKTPELVNTVGKTPDFCFDLWVPDTGRQTLTAKRSVLVLKQGSGSAQAEVYKQARVIIELGPGIADALKKEGTHRLRIDAQQANGRVLVSLPAE